MERFKLLLSPWKNEFIETIAQAKKELFVSSPFINTEGVKILSNAVKVRHSVELSLVTNLTTKNIINQFTEPKALLELHKQFARVKVSSLGRLHAKVYLIDDRLGIITSANLTSGGLIGNFEYGVLIKDRNVISDIKEDMLKYFALGNIFDKDILQKVYDESENLRDIRRKTENYIQSTKLALLLKKHSEILDLELLKNRVKENKTINAIFSDTILYILKKKGHLTTAELHPLIQSIHPDICDDSIE